MNAKLAIKIIVLAVVCCQVVAKGSQARKKLLIVLVDGFRHDFADLDSSLIGFPRMERGGVRAECVRPIFPANSYPNWYAIATGLFAESHGMIDNYFYDGVRGQFFQMGTNQPNDSDAHWWTAAEPIWVRAERSGVRTAMFNWDGCQVDFNGTKPSLCVPYRFVNNSEYTRLHLEAVLDHFEEGSYRLAMVYHEPVDHFSEYAF